MTISLDILGSILRQYGFCESPRSYEVLLRYVDSHTTKLIVSVTLTDERRLVVKLMRDHEAFAEQGTITENQSMFSELLRSNGIRTPQRYTACGRYCTITMIEDIAYHTTLEDWCGVELPYIQMDIACKLGALMAQMHTISFQSGFRIGRGTIFGEAPNNDFDAYPDFCRIAEDPRLDQAVASQIKALYEQKTACVHALWHTLPIAATQGDLSVNNIARGADGELTVFDYNIAGDEAMVSDMVLEGLFLAYQMDLPPECPPDYRETVFPAFYEGYLSIRSLTENECTVAWELYTMYHSLWASTTDELEALAAAEKYEEANLLLARVFLDLSLPDDGRFRA